MVSAENCSPDSNVTRNAPRGSGSSCEACAPRGSSGFSGARSSRGPSAPWRLRALCVPGRGRTLRTRAGQGADAADARRAVGSQLKLVLVGAVVGGDYVGGGGGGIGKRGGHAWQIRDVVGLSQRQGIPPMTPGAAGGGIGIDKQKVLGGDKAAGGELVGRRQACLARADDDAEVVLHRAIVAGVKIRRMLWLTT